MLNKNNIEELFKSGLENLESPVPTDVWTGIETNLPASGSVSATTGIAKSLLTKLAIGVVSVGAISYGIYHFTNSTDSSNENITEVSPVTSENNLKITEESGSSENNAQPNNSENINFTTEATEKTEETEKSSEVKTYPKNHINKPNTYIPTSTENNPSNNNSSGEKNTNNANVSGDNGKKNETSTTNNPNTEKTVENETPLAVEIIANETEGKIPLNVSLKLDKEVNQVVWVLPNGKEISSAELNHTFEKLGKHIVKVKATDNKGKTATSEITVNVLPSSFIKLPPAVGGVRPFYANGSNIFNVEFENVVETEGVIWDLKGNEVYKFNTIEGAKWDGKNMIGNICEPGVYFMLIKATGFDGYPAKPERISINLTR